MDKLKSELLNTISELEQMKRDVIVDTLGKKYTTLQDERKKN